MKTLVALLSLAAFAQADDLKLADGTVFRDAKLERLGENVRVTHADGVATIKPEALPVAWQARLSTAPAAPVFLTRVAGNVPKDQAANFARAVEHRGARAAELAKVGAVWAEVKVRQISAEGILASATVDIPVTYPDGGTTKTGAMSEEKEWIFIRGLGKGLVDGAKFEGALKRDGEFRYTQRFGGPKTVEAYKVVTP